MISEYFSESRRSFFKLASSARPSSVIDAPDRSNASSDWNARRPGPVHKRVAKAETCGAICSLQSSRSPSSETVVYASSSSSTEHEAASRLIPTSPISVA